MSEGDSIRLMRVGLIFSTICLPFGASEDVTAVAQIPFSFAVGRVNFPSGDYEISPMLVNRDEMLIRPTGGKVNFVFPTEPIEVSTPKRFGYLVFTSTREGRFLSQIWTPGKRIGRHIPAALVESTEDFREPKGRKG